MALYEVPLQVSSVLRPQAIQPKQVDGMSGIRMFDEVGHNFTNHRTEFESVPRTRRDDEHVFVLGMTIN